MLGGLNTGGGAPETSAGGVGGGGGKDIGGNGGGGGGGLGFSPMPVSGGGGGDGGGGGEISAGFGFCWTGDVIEELGLLLEGFGLGNIRGICWEQELLSEQFWVLWWIPPCLRKLNPKIIPVIITTVRMKMKILVAFPT